MQRFSSKNFNVNKTNTTHSFMTPKSMSSEVENIEIKAKKPHGRFFSNFGTFMYLSLRRPLSAKEKSMLFHP